MATQPDMTTSPSTAGFSLLRNRRLTMAQRRTVVGYIFIMPFILGFLFWFLIPALASVYLTFQKWNLISPPQFVGLQNIQHLFNDPLLPQSLKATFLYSFISVPLSLILSFFLATPVSYTHLTLPTKRIV